MLNREWTSAKPLLIDVSFRSRKNVAICLAISWPFVDQGPAREADDVEESDIFHHRSFYGGGGAPPDDIELAFELLRVKKRAFGNEDLPNDRLCFMSHTADRGTIDRHITPPEGTLPLFLDNPLQHLFAELAMLRVGRQKHHAHAVLPGARKLNPNFSALLHQKLMGNLKSDSRSISRLRITTARATMTQVRQHFQRLADNVV